jgi:hypothetical protein
MKIIAFFLLFSSVAMYAQEAKREMKANGIYTSSNDFKNHKLTAAFNRSDGYKFSSLKKQSISIKTKSARQTFFTDSIWGYRRDGIDWRLFNEQVYQVVYSGKVIIYTTPGVPGDDTHEWTYISRNLDAPIHDLSRPNLIAIFHSDTAFVNKIRSLPWTTSIEKWDKEKHRYQFINWLSPIPNK